MADDLEIQVFTFRAGWQVRNFHSAFDYIINSKKKDSISGKVLAGWNYEKGSDITTGYPPNIDGIKSKKCKFIAFTNELFEGV